VSAAVYNFHGTRCSSDIHDGAIVVHKRGEGRDLTNQQPCTRIDPQGRHPQEHRPHRTAQYPQILQWADRFFAVYSSEKTDIMVEEIPNEMLVWLSTDAHG
jgi:hypothetical protein